MKKHLSFEDLSSFVDGEHADMASVQKHLQQCEECARSHVDMTKLSSHVQALPEPEVSDAFARSVMRAFDEAEESRSRGWMLRFGMPLAAAAALVLLAVSVMLRPASVDSPTMTAQDAPVDAPVNDFTFSVASVNEALAEDDYSGPVDTPEVYAAEVLLALGDTDLFTGITATWLADSDYNDHLDRLDSDEKQTLIELLGSTMIDESLL